VQEGASFHGAIELEGAFIIGLDEESWLARYPKKQKGRRDF
jgi:hypothetical protein